MDNTIHQPIAILGAGSWGTALALYLSRLGQAVRLWTYQDSHVAAMIAEQENSRYLPGYTFPQTLQPVTKLADALANTNEILIAVPSHAFHDTLLTLKPLLTAPAKIVWATKGIDPSTGELLHDVALDILGNQHEYAILSGPSFAREVAAGLPTAVVAASHNPLFAKQIIARFNSPLLRVYSSTDMTGVEIGGIVKNVLGIATGILDGMELGANARSALITRGLAEMIRLGVAVGGQRETFYGLTGLGDLILTCTDNQSRNRRFGLALGKGKNPETAEKEIGQVVEGKRNAELVIQLAKKHHIEMPISEAVWDILSGKLNPAAAVQNLINRMPKSE